MPLSFLVKAYTLGVYRVRCGSIRSLVMNEIFRGLWRLALETRSLSVLIEQGLRTNQLVGIQARAEDLLDNQFGFIFRRGLPSTAEMEEVTGPIFFLEHR